MDKMNHGIANGYKYRPPVDKYKHDYIIHPLIGFIYLLPQTKLAIKRDFVLPDYMPFVVTHIYDHVVLMLKSTKHGLHPQALDMWTFKHYAIPIDINDIESYTNQFYGVSIELTR